MSKATARPKPRAIAKAKRSPQPTLLTIRTRTAPSVARPQSRKPTPGRITIQFGSVTVEADAPSEAQVARNVKAGQEALARAAKVLLKPGVRLKFAKGVPRFEGDPQDPSTGVIRILGRKRERGTFVDGRFVASKK